MLEATASVTGGAGSPMAQWRWRGSTITGQSGLTLAASVAGPIGSGQLDVTVNDGSGKTGNQFTILALDKPRAQTQPPPMISVVDHNPGTLFGSDGVSGVSLLASRKKAGLLVIVHGIYAKVQQATPDDPCADWMIRLAQSIESKMASAPNGPPNVLLYDWQKSADPSNDRGTDQYEKPSSIC